MTTNPREERVEKASQQDHFDRKMMERCVVLADEAHSAGNTAVGSLVVLGEEILSEAAEECPNGEDPFAHAELIAIRNAVQLFGHDKVQGATLYTTKEPCFMCSYAIRWAAIGSVVYSEPIEGIGGLTSTYPICSAKEIQGWADPPQIRRQKLSGR